MILKNAVVSIGLALSACLAATLPASAQLEVEVNQASAREYRVALPDFNANTAEAQALA